MFDVIARMGSIGSKVLGFGMTALGLKKLWSKESTEKHTLPALTAFSGAYVLHMGTTTLASAVMFGSEAVSAPVATALLSSTSLLTSYANLMEAYFSHSLLKSKYNVLENQLTTSNLDLQRSLALIQSVTECESDMQLLNSQIDDIRGVLMRLNGAHEAEALKGIYLELYSKYQERIAKNDTLVSYFSDIRNAEDVNLIFNDLRAKISEKHEEIQQIRTKLQAPMQPESQERLQNKIAQCELQLKEYGIINIQCIRYVKIEEHIKLLQALHDAIDHKQNLTSEASRINEVRYLDNRIASLKGMLIACLRPQDFSQTLDLDFGAGVMLDDYIAEDSLEFKSWLEKNLIQHIQSIEKQRDDLRVSAENVERCFREFIKEPINDIQAHRSKIRQIEQEKVQLQCNLSLEKLNEEARKTRLNLSTVASLVALTLCLVPQGELATLLRPLMLGMGLFGGALSLWTFYTKNMLAKKVETQKQNKIRCLDRALEFTNTHDMERTSSADLENLERMLRESAVQIDEPKSAVQIDEPESAPKARRVLPTRAAKDKTNRAITLVFSTSRTRKRSSSSQEATSVSESTLQIEKRTRRKNNAYLLKTQ